MHVRMRRIKYDYTKNVFIEREKLRKHRDLPYILEYKQFLKSYPR